MYITRIPRVASRRKSFYRSCSTTITPANSRKGQSRFVEKRVRSPKTIFKAGTSLSHILNKSNSAQQRKCGLGTNGRHYDAMCVSWNLSNLAILRKSAIFYILIKNVIFFVLRTVLNYYKNNYLL